jgi:hypothetical protein
MKMNNNPQFFPWLLGFLDAEGSFITNLVPRINKQNLVTSYRILYRIQIGLNIKDKAILELISSKLPLARGKIYNYPEKEESCLCFTSFESMNYLIDNVFSKYPLMTEYQLNRYEKLRQGLQSKMVRVDSIEEFNAIKTDIVTPNFNTSSSFFLDQWLVGFLNGEVCFTQFNGKAGNLKPKVSLEHTDEQALIFFKSHLNLGPQVSQLKQRANRKITYRIDVTSVHDLSKICSFLDKTDTLLGNKKDQYNV